jgi:LuxR family transcriptional regulator
MSFLAAPFKIEGADSMRHWSDTRRKALVALGKHLDPLFDNISPLAQDLGFDSWRFVVLDHSLANPPLLLKTTLADSFVNDYIAQRFWEQDPRHQHGLTSVQPLRWEPALFNEAPQLWQAMRDVDVTHGMSQACHHNSGLTALLCFGRARVELGLDEFHSKTDIVLSVAHQLTVATVDRIASDEILESKNGEADKPLTRREVMVLEKTAAGHTAGHIATDLCLSERTVQFHISSAISKLDVPNKTAAVAQAILLGLIDWPQPGVA